MLSRDDFQNRFGANAIIGMVHVDGRVEAPVDPDRVARLVAAFKRPARPAALVAQGSARSGATRLPSRGRQIKPRAGR